MFEKQISYEYIRGLIEGEGCFTFCSSGNGDKKIFLPTFSLGMSERDEDLINLIKSRLGLRNTIYKYSQVPLEYADGRVYSRRPNVKFMVRDPGQIKNIIVPLCYKKLHGNKALQFESWIERFNSDPLVPSTYKFIHRLYKNGYYDANHSFD